MGRVRAVEPFEDWFPSQFDAVSTATDAAQLFAELDIRGPGRMVDADSGFGRVFQSKDVKPAAMAVAVRALPKEYAGGKDGRFRRVLEGFAASADPGLKAAAGAKLADARAP